MNEILVDSMPITCSQHAVLTVTARQFALQISAKTQTTFARRQSLLAAATSLCCATCSMSNSVSDDVLKGALRKRRKYIESNLNDLTMKACRKLLEEDLGLPDRALADRKGFIQKYIDKIIDRAEAKKTEDNHKSSKKKSDTAPAAKKRKSSADNDDGGDDARPSAQPRTSKIIDKVKQICKAATIKIPPSMYVKTKSLSQVEADMKALLEKHDLSLSSSSHEISKAATRLAKERDLEGIDVSNIVQGGRRARRAAAAAAPINYAAIDRSGSSSDDDDDEDSGASSSQDQSSDQADASDGDAEGDNTNAHQQQEVQSGLPAANGAAHDAADASKLGRLPEDTSQDSAQDMEDSDAERVNTKKRKAVLYDSDYE